jgi:hypothetical protein
MVTVVTEKYGSMSHYNQKFNSWLSKFSLLSTPFSRIQLLFLHFLVEFSNILLIYSIAVLEGQGYLDCIHLKFNFQTLRVDVLKLVAGFSPR